MFGEILQGMKSELLGEGEVENRRILGATFGLAAAAGTAGLVTQNTLGATPKQTYNLDFGL